MHAALCQDKLRSTRGLAGTAPELSHHPTVSPDSKDSEVETLVAADRSFWLCLLPGASHKTEEQDVTVHSLVKKSWLLFIWGQL